MFKLHADRKSCRDFVSEAAMTAWEAMFCPKAIFIPVAGANLRFAKRDALAVFGPLYLLLLSVIAIAAMMAARTGWSLLMVSRA
jgi:hypothetical protein